MNELSLFCGRCGSTTSIMVCIPCIVIPFVLWFFHKYIQPYIAKLWNPWKKVEGSKVNSTAESTGQSESQCPMKTLCKTAKLEGVPDSMAKEVGQVDGGDDKKRD